MRPSYFENIIQLQFNALMLVVIKRTMMKHKKQMIRRSNYETSLDVMPELSHPQGSVNTYSCDVMQFIVSDSLFEISNYEVAYAIRQLSEKQRQSIVLYYFGNMADREISEMYHVSRSTIRYHRNKGLNKLRHILSERE